MTKDDKSVTDDQGNIDAKNDFKSGLKQKSSEVVCSLCSGIFFIVY